MMEYHFVRTSACKLSDARYWISYEAAWLVKRRRQSSREIGDKSAHPEGGEHDCSQCVMDHAGAVLRVCPKRHIVLRVSKR